MRSAVLLLSLVLTACDSGSVPAAEAQGAQETQWGQGVHISPSRNGDLVFSRAALPVIRTAFVNSSSQAVYLFDAFPGMIRLEKREGDRWIEQPLPYGTAAVVPMPLSLDSEEYQPLWDLPLSELDRVGLGTYRVQAFVFEDAGFERLLPEPSRVSPEFEIVD